MNIEIDKNSIITITQQISQFFSDRILSGLIKDGMRTDLLMSLCDKYLPKTIYTMPNFHNPTGYSMSSKRKAELLDIAKYNNSIIVEDDPWSEISYRKEKVRSIKSMDTDGHVIYIKGLSKILGPAYRLAAIVSSYNNKKYFFFTWNHMLC